MKNQNIFLKQITHESEKNMLDILTSNIVNRYYMLPDFACREDAIPLFHKLINLSMDEKRYVRGIYLEEDLIGFLNDVEITNGAIELGYVIHPAFHGKGYMTKALKTAVSELFTMDYQEVITGAFDENVASIRVMEKAGMTRMEKTEEIEYRGKEYHCIYYHIKKTGEIMLKYKCLVLDHDDTVVQSMKTLSYPFFCIELEQFRPGAFMSLEDYILECHRLGFAELCRQRFHFTDDELKLEHKQWMEYVMQNIPDPYPGINEIIHRQKEEGGLICVVSHSHVDNITRDYAAHFGVQPDAIYGWELPPHQRKPNSWPLEDIMSRFGLNPEDILVIDDMKLACMMAAPLGVQVCYAGWSGMGIESLSDEMNCLCEFSFDTTEEMYRFLFEE